MFVWHRMNSSEPVGAASGTQKVYESTQPIDGLAEDATNGEIAFVGSALSGDLWDGSFGVLHVGDKEDAAATLKMVAGLPSGTSSVRWLTSDILVLGNDEGLVSVVRVTAEGLMESLCDECLHDDMVASVDANKERSIVASGSYDGTVKLWNADDVQSGRMPLRACFTQADECHGVAWTGTDMVTAVYADGMLCLYDPRANACVVRVKCGDLALTAVAASAEPAWSVVAVGDDSGVVQLWDLTKMGDSKPVYTCKPHSWACTALALHVGGDGRLMIASGGEDRRVVVHAVERTTPEDGMDQQQLKVTEVYTDRSHKDAVNALLWQKKGDHPVLLSASRDKTILQHRL